MPDVTVNQNLQGGAVNFYCNLTIKNRPIIAANIIHLCIKEWIFDLVPRIEIVLNDDGSLTEMFPLQDGDIISIELKKNQQDTPAINLDFLLVSYTGGVMHGDKFMQLLITGTLKVDNFYSPIKIRSFTKQSSKSVLVQLLSSEGQKTLNASVPTVDVMTWLQIHQTNLDFCKHLLKRSYVANDTMFLYADTKGEFNYTSFKTEAEKTNEGTARYDLQKYSADIFEDNADYKDYWFNNFNIYDFYGYVNKIRNYGVSYTYYDTSSGRQAAELTDDSHLLSSLTGKDKNNAGQMTHEFDLGYLPVDNVYSDYYKAMVQNDYYKHNLFSGFILELNINSLGKPRLFSKVNVILPSLLGTGENQPMSGDYLVAGVVHEIGKATQYRKRMALIRNGFNASQFMTANTVK